MIDYPYVRTLKPVLGDVVQGVHPRFQNYRQTLVEITGSTATAATNKWVYSCMPVKVKLESDTTSAAEFAGSRLKYVIDTAAQTNLPATDYEDDEDGNSVGKLINNPKGVNGYELNNTPQATMVLNGKTVDTYDTNNTYTVEPLPNGLVLLATLYPLSNPGRQIPVDADGTYENVDLVKSATANAIWFFSAPNPVTVVCGT